MRARGWGKEPQFRRRRAYGALDAARALARRIQATVQVYAGERLAGEFHPDGQWVWY